SGVSNGLVCGELADADADRPRDPHQAGAVSAKSCIWAADCHDGGDHVDRRAHPNDVPGTLSRVHAAATAVLVPSGTDAARLYAADARCEDVADSACVDLEWLTRGGVTCGIGGSQRSDRIEC